MLNDRDIETLGILLAILFESFIFYNMRVYNIAAFREQKKKNTESTQTKTTSFHKGELRIILPVYGRMVAAGEWRDYGISCLADVAVFSVFCRTSDYPQYSIEKWPELNTRKGMYLVRASDGRILKRGHNLKQVLQVLEFRILRLVC